MLILLHSRWMYLYLDVSIAYVYNSIIFPHPAQSSPHISSSTLWAAAWAGASLSRPEAVVTAQAQDFRSLSPQSRALAAAFRPSRAVTSLNQTYMVQCANDFVCLLRSVSGTERPA
jgi:hypothetical protein